MGKQNYNNKPLRRVAALLEFLLNKAEGKPEKEIFTFQPKELSDFHVLLSESEPLEIAFAKILENTETKLEFRQSPIPMPTATGEYYDYSIWVHVVDIRKLRDYLYETKETLKKEEGVHHFVLSGDGLFYLEGDKKLSYQFDVGQLRYKLLHFLASKKVYITTGELARRFSEENRPKIRKVVGEIRSIIERKMKVPGGSLFESDGKSGYRVTNVSLPGNE